MNRTRKLVLMNVGAIATVAALASALSLQATRAQGTLPTKSYLPINDAFQAASAALAQCETDGYFVSVAIVDRDGNLKAFMRGDSSGPQTIKGSERKAFTAAAFGQPTSNLASTVADNPAQAGIGNLDDRVILLGGGLPIAFGGEVVGGIGVAGAPGSNLDEDCAMVGLDAIGADTGMSTATPETTGTTSATGTATALATGTTSATGTATALATGTTSATGTATALATGTTSATGTATATALATSTVDLTGTPDSTETPIAIGTVDLTGTPDGTPAGTPDATATP